MNVGDKVRIVRTNGQVESDWEYAGHFTAFGGVERVRVRRWSEDDNDYLIKSPRAGMFDYWQSGGTAATTAEWVQEVQPTLEITGDQT